MTHVCRELSVRKDLPPVALSVTGHAVEEPGSRGECEDVIVRDRNEMMPAPLPAP
jgi:hypothetical protein